MDVLQFYLIQIINFKIELNNFFSNVNYDIFQVCKSQF